MANEIEYALIVGSSYVSKQIYSAIGSLVFCRPTSADFYTLGYQPNPPLQRDASPASRLRAPELAR